MIYNLYGSADSQDYDVLVLCNDTDFKDKQLCKQLCAQYEQAFPYQDKPVNVNLASSNGQALTGCYKGIVDELNNSLYHTYGNHQQPYPSFTKTHVERRAGIKIARAMRTIIAFYSRSEARQQVKWAMKNTIKDMFVVAQALDFNQIAENHDRLEQFKSSAFQLAQSIALLQGVEIFTKAEACSFMPSLAPLIKREAIADYNTLMQTCLAQLYVLAEPYYEEKESYSI